MAKRKKRKGVKRSPKRPSTKLMGELASAMELYEEGDPVAARQQLLQLARKHPRSKPILLTLLEVSEEMQDWNTYAYYSEQLLPFERGQDRAETLNNLVYAYTQLLYPALAWKYAKELMTEYPDIQHIKQVRSFVEMTEPILLQEVGEIMPATVFTQDEMVELMVLNDRVRYWSPDIQRMPYKLPKRC